jgi:hypothetical protein
MNLDIAYLMNPLELVDAIIAKDGPWIGAPVNRIQEIVEGTVVLSVLAPR